MCAWAVVRRRSRNVDKFVVSLQMKEGVRELDEDPVLWWKHANSRAKMSVFLCNDQKCFISCVARGRSGL